MFTKEHININGFHNYDSPVSKFTPAAVAVPPLPLQQIFLAALLRFSGNWQVRFAKKGFTKPQVSNSRFPLKKNMFFGVNTDKKKITIIHILTLFIISGA